MFEFLQPLHVGGLQAAVLGFLLVERTARWMDVEVLPFLKAPAYDLLDKQDDPIAEFWPPVPLDA
jgi:hypothetical protein